MKMIPILMLAVFAVPVHAQSSLGALQSYQKSQPATVKPSDQISGGAPAAPSKLPKVAASKMCESNTQSSLPQKYLLGIISSTPAQLSIQHDPRSGVLSVSANPVIGNCASMIDLDLKQRSLDAEGSRVYSVEARVSGGLGCSGGLCTYKIPKVVDGVFKQFEEMKFSPTMQGFEECLVKSGVIKDGKVVSSAIYPGVVSDKFTGIKESGKVNFVSRGPSSALVGAAFGKFSEVDGCDHYEELSDTPLKVVSEVDTEKARIAQEKLEVKDCQDYSRISQFIEKYESQSGDLIDIRDKLITDAAKKSFEAIKAGKYTADDLQVIADFDEYLVQPKIDEAANLYEELMEAAPEDKKGIQEDLSRLQVQLASYNKEPLASVPLVQKLMADAQFDQAAQVNKMRLNLTGYSQLGVKRLGEVVTPNGIDKQVEKEDKKFVAALEVEREKYEIKTGQIPGRSKKYAALMNKMSQNISVRTQNYNQEIASEYARMQPGGACYRMFFQQRIASCIQDSQARAQELEAEKAHYNNRDAQKAQEYQAKAQEYSKLEEEGKRFIASQGGDPAAVDEAQDSIAPSARNNGAYTFDYNNPNSRDQQLQGQQQNYQQQQPQQSYLQNTQQMFQQNYQQPYQQQNFQQQSYQQPYQQNYQQNYMQPQQQQYIQQQPYQNQNYYMNGMQTQNNYMGYQNQNMYNQNMGYQNQFPTAYSNYSMYR